MKARSINFGLYSKDKQGILMQQSTFKKFYLFKNYYECRSCYKLGGERGMVKNDHVIRNPEAGHTELCAPIDAISVEASA
uniref:Uncharacterized protein n=1 Tax=Romanomermis culicivorax TaxID=13658 RepID=A0A915J321_ROMCU